MEELRILEPGLLVPTAFKETPQVDDGPCNLLSRFVLGNISREAAFTQSDCRKSNLRQRAWAGTGMLRLCSLRKRKKNSLGSYEEEEDSADQLMYFRGGDNQRYISPSGGFDSGVLGRSTQQ